MSKATLVITRGLPGSGKTTRAKEWVAADPGNRARVNRDDLRESVFGGFVRENEYSLVKARDSFVKTLLKRGFSVVVDDTNLPNKTVRSLISLSPDSYEVWDSTDVPLDTCLERNSSPERRNSGREVPEEVIRDMYQRFVKGKSYPLPLPEIDSEELEGLTPYTAPDNVPRAILVDLDGTTALHNGRSPYDMTRVYEDDPNKPVVEAVRAMYKFGYRVVFLSARTEDARQDTERWLSERVRVPYEALLLRQIGDGRRDSQVKYEIFNEHIRNNYAVGFVLDDRDSVVRMWRSIGVPCFQVAPGSF